MAQGLIPVEYVEDARESGVTAFAGLPIYLDLFQLAGFRSAVDRLVPLDTDQGYTSAQVVTAVVLLNLAGGDCVDDLAMLEHDDGFGRVYERVETYGMSRSEKAALDARFRVQRTNVLPSPAATRRYLARFHDESQEAAYHEAREAKRAYIWKPNAMLEGLAAVNTELVATLQRYRPKSTATLDLDASLVRGNKKEAAWCYKGFKGYQPLQTWWHEQGVVLCSEFRDGNVPAQFELLRSLKAATAALPSGVPKAYMRSDSAGYQIELLRYCAEGKDPRFGVIEFAVSSDVTPSFKEEVAKVPETSWKPLVRKTDSLAIDTGQQWAEVEFVPSWAGYSKNSPRYRFLAVRELMAQPTLAGVEEAQQAFPTMEFAAAKGCFKLFGVVTNRLTMPGDEVIWWLRERCGDAEQAHSVMKSDLSCGTVPSGSFGANAAWWAMMIIAYTLHVLLRALAFPDSWQKFRFKAWRFKLLRLAGRVVEHARGLIIRLPHAHPAYEILAAARGKLVNLARGPTAEVSA